MTSLDLAAGLLADPSPRPLSRSEADLAALPHSKGSLAMKRLASLDQISLDLMIAGTKAAGVRRTQKNMQDCARLQIAIREALRAVLPPDDPRRDPAYPFNQE